MATFLGTTSLFEDRFTRDRGNAELYTLSQDRLSSDRQQAPTTFPPPSTHPNVDGVEQIFVGPAARSLPGQSIQYGVIKYVRLFLHLPGWNIVYIPSANVIARNNIKSKEKKKSRFTPNNMPKRPKIKSNSIYSSPLSFRSACYLIYRRNTSTHRFA